MTLITRQDKGLKLTIQDLKKPKDCDKSFGEICHIIRTQESVQ